MSTPAMNKRSQIPQDAFHDPLRTFNESAWRKTYGLGDNVQVDPFSGDVSVSSPKKTPAAEKKSSAYEQGSPSSKMKQRFSGAPKKQRTTKSGIILMDGIDTGAGKHLLTSDQRVKALGHRATFDRQKKVWAPEVLATSPYFQSGKAHGANLFAKNSHRTESAPERAAGPRKPDSSLKVPTFKISTGGPGSFIPGTYYRDRSYQLVPQEKAAAAPAPQSSAQAPKKAAAPKKLSGGQAKQISADLDRLDRQFHAAMAIPTGKPTGKAGGSHQVINLGEVVIK